MSAVDQLFNYQKFLNKKKQNKNLNLQQTNMKFKSTLFASVTIIIVWSLLKEP